MSGRLIRRRLADVFAVQQEIAGSVVKAQVIDKG